MRRILLWAGNLLLILSAVFCTLCAIITAYDFPVKIQNLFFIWLAACLLISAFTTLWRSKGLLMCLPPVLILLYFNLPGIIAGGKWVIFFISNEFSKYFPSLILFSDASASQGEITLFFAAVGIILSLLLSLAVCLWHSTFFTFSLTFPIVAFSLVIEPFAPDTWLLVVLLAVYITMMVSSAFHPDNLVKRGLAFFPALALAGLLLGIAYLVASPEQYTRSDWVVSFDSRINRAFSQGGFNWEQLGADLPNIRTDGWRFNKEYVSVADAGSRIETGQTILNVTASRSGTYYLRGYSMQIFDGRAWNSNSDTFVPDNYQLDVGRPIQVEIYQLDVTQLIITAIQSSSWYPDDAPEPVEMHVDKSGDRSDMLYLPYYTLSGSDNDTSAESYDISFLHLESKILHYAAGLGANSFVPDLSEYNSQVHTAYTQIDPSTAVGLRELAIQAGIDPDTDRASIADQVADYVSSSARYTLSPPPIPADEDFALYFLETAKLGYCIHFATAATLMLRALDVPARFTSGFTVTLPEAGSSAAITDRQSHAWVEVYYDDIGWVPLEVTPSSGNSNVPEQNSHAPANVPDHVSGPAETTPNSQQPTAAPGDTPGQQNNPASADTGSTAYRPVLYTLLSVAAIAVILQARRLTARAYRKKRFGQADRNAAVICAWRYASRLHGHKTSPPDDIEDLALKARFSRHTLSEEERAAVIDYAIRLSHDTDRRLNPLQQFWLRYVRGLY